MFDLPPIAVPDPPPWFRRWMRHEWLLGLLGVYTTLAMVIRCGLADWSPWYVAAATVVYLAFVDRMRRATDDRGQKVRLFAGYLYVLWFFLSVAWMVPALRLPQRDGFLLSLDRSLFGETPSIALQGWASVPLTELMSVCYLSFLVYLHVAVVDCLFRSTDHARRFASWILSVYAIGLPGYLLVPAIGPGKAFPESFATTIDGWWLTALNQAIVERGSGVFDVFPSLHVLITAALLAFDYRNGSQRFRIMLLPFVGLVVSTVYLRFHYAVDLLAGAAVFMIAWLVFRVEGPRDVATVDGS